MKPNQTELESQMEDVVIVEDDFFKNTSEDVVEVSVDPEIFKKEKNKFALSALFLFFTNFLLFIAFVISISSPLDVSYKESSLDNFMVLICLIALPFNLFVFIKRSYIKNTEDVQNLTRAVIYWSVMVFFIFTFFIKGQLG